MGLLFTMMMVLAASDVPAADVVSPDGGEVPTVAPDLTPHVAPLMAPELVADAGTVIAEPRLSVYQVDLPVEITVTAGSLALYGIVDFLVKPTLEGDLSCRQPVGPARCNPADLTVIDRWAVGRTSKEWTMFSDVALYSSMLIPTLYLALESVVLPTAHPWKDFAGDLLVVTEAMALTAAFQTVMKFAIRRPRPIRYTETDLPLTSFDQELSFPSGHTSMVAAATTALTATIFLRHPKSPMRWAALGGGIVMTALTAWARVEGGHHFPTDVLIGTMIGAFSGFAVPYLHRFQLPVAPVAAFNPTAQSGMLGLTGRF